MPEWRTLLLVRHAKSSWSDAGLADHDRPLNGRGRRDAPRMGRRIVERGTIPDRVVSSSAVRALTTARILAAECEIDETQIVVDPDIYGAAVDEMIELIHDLDDSDETVMLVGHNPTFLELSNRLTDTERHHLPTCAVVTARLNAPSWSDAAAGRFELIDFDYPKKDGDAT